MNSDQIMKAIEKIAATPGKNDKQALVKAYSAFPQFVRVLKAALDPTITYGIGKVPPRKEGSAPGANTFEDAPIWQVIDDLALRRLTGNAARETIAKWLIFLTPESGELFKRIIEKDLKAGFGDSTVNKAVGKGTIPTFPYMRCSLEKDLSAKNDLSTWPWESGVISQEKADGMFMNVNNDTDVTFSSRAGSQFDSAPFANVAADIDVAFPKGVQLHGEMLVKRNGVVLPREVGNGILNHILDGGGFEPGDEPFYLVWDEIPLSAVVPKGKYETPYKQRLAAIIKALAAVMPINVALIPTKIVRSRREAMLHAVEMMKNGKEGTIVKHPDMPWADGTSNRQVKQKLEFEVDLKIVDKTVGNGKFADTFGALTCETSDGLLRVDVSGFKDEVRKQVNDAWDTYKGTIMAVKANMVMQAKNEGELHSLFLPRVAEFRKDKTEADSYARCLQIEEAAKQGEDMLKEAA